MARVARVRRPDRHLRRRRRTPTCARTTIEDRGVDGMRARVTTPAGERVIETPLLGRGNLPTCSRRRPWRSMPASRSTTIAAAPPRLAPADRRGAVQRLRDGITADRRLLQLEPDGAAARARRGRAREHACDAQGRGARRDARARRPRDWRCTRSAAAPRPQPVCALLFAVGGAPARALADAAVAAGMPPTAVRYFEQSDDAAPAVVRGSCAAATSCWSRDRAARAPTSWPIVSRRSSA